MRDKFRLLRQITIPVKDAAIAEWHISIEYVY